MKSSQKRLVVGQASQIFVVVFSFGFADGHVKTQLEPSQFGKVNGHVSQVFEVSFSFGFADEHFRVHANAEGSQFGLTY